MALRQPLRAVFDDPARMRAVRAAFGAFVLSRGIVGLVAILATRNLGSVESDHDVPSVTHPFGDWPLQELLDGVFSPLARWDAVWYLLIAQDGYAGGEQRFDAGGEPVSAEYRAAFFPLYPLAVRAVAGFTESAGASLIAAYAVSLAAFFVALYLFYRLVDLELGSEIARVAVLLLALAPSTVFFSAPYSESLFLLTTVGAFYAARTGRWAWAGALGAAAAATRNTGIILLLPLALLYLYRPDGGGVTGAGRGLLARLRPTVRVRPDAVFLLLVPVGLVLVCVHMANVFDDPFAWREVQGAEGFGRSVDGPIGGLLDAIEAGWYGLRDLATGGGEPDGLQRNTFALAVLGAAGAGAVWLFRSLHPAYGAYVVAALLPAISAPDDYTPLLSLPRFVTVLFPLFMCLAAVAVRRRATEPVIACSALLAGLFTAQFATWQGNAN
jgi:hypothetical protein